MEEGSTLWWIEQHRLRALERDEALSKLESVSQVKDSFIGDLQDQIKSLREVVKFRDLQVGAARKRLEDLEEDAKELAGKLKGSVHEPLALGIHAVTVEALTGLGTETRVCTRDMACPVSGHYHPQDPDLDEQT